MYFGLTDFVLEYKTMGRRSSSVLDPITPVASRNMRARTLAEPSVAAADSFEVNVPNEAEMALHTEHTAHSGVFSTAAADEQAGALGGLENASLEVAAGASLDAGLDAEGHALPHVRNVQPHDGSSKGGGKGGDGRGSAGGKGGGKGGAKGGGKGEEGKGKGKGGKSKGGGKPNSAKGKGKGSKGGKGGKAHVPLPVFASVVAMHEMVGGVSKLKTKIHLCPAEADNATAKSSGCDPFNGMKCTGWKDGKYSFEFSNGGTITPEMALHWLSHCLSNMPATSEMLTIGELDVSVWGEGVMASLQRPVANVALVDTLIVRCAPPMPMPRHIDARCSPNSLPTLTL